MVGGLGCQTYEVWHSKITETGESNIDIGSKEKK